MGCSNSAPLDPAPNNEATSKKLSGNQSDFKIVHSSVRWKKLDEVKSLLQEPDSINIPDPQNGNRPIHIAAQNGHIEILEMLIAKNAEVNSKNTKGNTALHMAISYDYYDCSIYLVANGADKNIKNDSGFDAIKGLEGDKSLGMVALISAERLKDAKLGAEALNMCETNIQEMEKGSFVSAGLKLKKALAQDWTDQMNSQFKSIANKITN